MAGTVAEAVDRTTAIGRAMATILGHHGNSNVIIVERSGTDPSNALSLKYTRHRSRKPLATPLPQPEKQPPLMTRTGYGQRTIAMHTLTTFTQAVRQT